MQRGNILDASADLGVVTQNESAIGPEVVATAKVFLANCRLYTKQPMEALTLIRDASQILPATYWLSSIRATVLLANGEYSEALRDLLDARKGTSREKEWSGPAGFLSKTAPILKANIEGGIEALIGEAYIGLGNASEARLQFLRVMDQYDVMEPDLLLKVAWGLIKVGEYGDVRRIQKHLANTFPNRPEAEFVNGLLKIELDDHTAVNDIESAILKDTKNVDLLRLKAFALMSMKDYEGVSRTVNRWVSLAPKDYLAYLVRGMVHAYQEDFLGAVQAFTLARDLNEDATICHFGLAIGLSELGRGTEAKESLQRGLDIDGKSDLAEYAHGMVALNSSNLDLALSHLTKAVQLGPGNGEFHYGLGLAYDRTGNHTAALEVLSRAGQLGYGKAFELIREIKRANLSWIDGPSDLKTPWNASLKEAAREVLAAYDSDQMKPPAAKRFANLKDASDQFFESHEFPKHPRLSKRGFYENVAKAKQ